MTHNERVSRWAQVSAALALQSDEQLTRVVDEAEPLATGIGGTTLAFEIEGIKVFAKHLRLTDIERRPENRLSTRRLATSDRFALSSDELSPCHAVSRW